MERGTYQTDDVILFLGDSGPRQVLFCGVVQYANLLGTSIGYTITAASSMVYGSYLPSCKL